MLSVSPVPRRSVPGDVLLRVALKGLKFLYNSHKDLLIMGGGLYLKTLGIATCTYSVIQACIGGATVNLIL